ncbi:MAG: hypothetical protein ISS23_02835 [Nanoarchaeota archaeon]|nr:hypothetical protein [Nanoarchaeota archaeon]
MRKTKIIILLFLALFFLFGCTQKFSEIKDLEYIELNGDENLVFNAINPLNSLAECSVYFSVEDDLKILGLGVFQPQEKRLIKSSLTFENGETDFTLDLKCETPENLKKCATQEEAYSQYFCLALINKDHKFCKKIDANFRKIWCEAFVLDQPELCSNIADKECKDWCYMDLGMNKRDRTLCDKIMDTGQKTSCIAVTTSNPDLCLEGDENYKLTCIETLAESMKDITLCDKLEDSSDECYEDMNWMQK